MNQEKEKEKKRSGGVLIWIILVVLAVGLGFGAKKLAPKAVSHDRSIDVNVLSGEMKSINELATMQYDYKETIHKEKDGILSTMYIMTFDGTIKAGINMDDVELDVQNPPKDSEEPPVVNVAVPDATILSHEDDNPETIYYEGNKSKGLGEERNQQIKKKKAEKSKEFIKNGNLDKAKEQAEEVIEEFIHSSYGEDVVVNFEDKK